VRLGSGDWDYPGSVNQTVWAGQRLFLSVVEELVPQVIERLKAVAPEYHEGAVDRIGSLPLGDLDTGDLPSADWTLVTALRAWSAEVHLVDQWVVQAALATLEAWTTVGETNEWHLARTAGLAWIRTDLPHPPAWVPTAQTWDAYVRRLRSHYRPQIERRMRDDGAVSTPELYRSFNGPADQHFRWLVRWQVAGETQKAIAANPAGDGSRSYVTERTVSYAIKGKADLIGLTRRTRISRD
jgi:hypothetical protein